jgi:hypothetical protein
VSGENKNPVGQMIGSLLQPYTEVRDRREPPVPPLTAEHVANLAQAAKVQTQIDVLIAEQDRLLDPIAVELMAMIYDAKPGDRARLETLVYLLPRGFHRSELVTALNKWVPYDDDDDGDDRK